MKNKIISISLLIILLPLITPNAMMAKENSTLPSNIKPDYGPVEPGAHLFYNISQFDWGSAAFDLLRMMLPAEVPDFDFGLINSLEGSEIEILISAMDNIPLYKWNETHGYHDGISETVLQAIGFLNLYDDFGFYANVSQFSFPDDFTKTDIHFYWETWPRSKFIDNVTSSVFWSNFNMTFMTQFDFGWYDYNNSWGYNPPDWDWPRAHWYDDTQLDDFAYDLGNVIGYDIGYWGCEFSGNNHLWYDVQAALDGFYTGFFDARGDGFTTGQSDFLTDRIPDKKAPMPPAITDMNSYARWQYYPRIYEDYYAGGYLYEGAQVYFNERLYYDLYNNAWNTWPVGYADGYHDGYYYYSGYWNGENDRLSANPRYTTWFPPPDPYYWDPRDSWESGYNVGIQDGYLAAYDDGFDITIAGEQYQWGMSSYREQGYFDGFDEGAYDSFNSLPESPLIILPYSPSTTDPFEMGANWIYEQQYLEGYPNGYLYESLVNSPSALDWTWSNGPFYNMTLPDFQFTFLANSILPAIPIDITMFTDLNFAIGEFYEYEFWWGSYDYWPFNERFVPFQTFDASDTDWVQFDTFDVAKNDTTGQPGFNTTYDAVNQYCLFEMHMNMSDAQLTQDVYWGYNTTTGKLLNVTASMNYYAVSDVWINITLELDDAKTNTPYVPSLPSPSSWTYSFDNVIFYYTAPPLAPTDFIDGVHEFKMNALSSIGHPALGVEMLEYEGLWAKANYTMYNPLDPLDPPYETTVTYPMFSPMGFHIIPDWGYYNGMVTTANSMLGVTDYFIQAFNDLDIQNTNFLITQLLLDAQVDSYHYTTGMDVMYYYITMDAEADIEWDALNGDYEWENTVIDGFIRGYIWVVVDYNSGVVLGAGLKSSFDFELTTVPDYGMSGTGILQAYLEILVSANFATPPPLDVVIGASSLPAISEFGIASILSIIGFAAIVSAVIFTKRRK
jgi:hypothetical protein